LMPLGSGGLAVIAGKPVTTELGRNISPCALPWGKYDRLRRNGGFWQANNLSLTTNAQCHIIGQRFATVYHLCLTGYI
jgi:hypothetical protein